MKSISIISKRVKDDLQIAGSKSFEVLLNGEKYDIAVVETMNPLFFEDDKTFDDLVLVKKVAFSLNFRDRAILARNRQKLNQKDAAFHIPMGSDFVAVVIGVGRNVRNISLGDRVIPNCAYPNEDQDGTSGVATNTASKQCQVFHKSKLIKISPSIPVEVAASFSIGCQTAFSIIRRLNLNGKERILITSGTSNTSLIVLQILAKKCADICVLTSRESAVPMLKKLGAKEVVLVKDRYNFDREENFIDSVKSNGGFDIVIDPFADIYLVEIVKYINMFGKYITCGVYHQYTDNENVSRYSPNQLIDVFAHFIIVNNLEIYGNCLGSSKDLEHALEAYENDEFNIQIDSIFEESDLKRFVELSFSDSNKFGKVVFKFSEDV